MSRRAFVSTLFALLVLYGALAVLALAVYGFLALVGVVS